ncbi:TonB-dependent receptor [Shewanella insulae]|uniref:TonB-dependent receptor n=1 Tax=Shewanella insulae TaxID=2681496 RepID=UPI001EFC3B5C|nr:TonB-dependent receptor [Shewanella insulae]MCG9757446.1 TonB-dependent receptor [Shewanella insulae]
MQPNSILAKAVRFALISGAATAALSASAVYAADEDSVERIQVTGSRIIREGAVAPTPVTVISGEELLATGATNIGEALNQLPALGNTYSLANSGRSIGTAGLNVLDLRNMGTARTLVLVDGKRHVSSSAGSQRVDVNTIPSTWVERVEVITGGASAIYGADAVTGVVNFILKEDVEGLDFSVTKGFADDSSHSKEKLSLSYGTDFDNGNGNVAFAIEYAGQDRLRSLDRDQTAISFTELRNQNQQPGSVDPNDPDKILTPNAGYYAINNAGVFNLDGWKTFNPDGSIRDVYTGSNVDGVKCADCDSFNLRQFSDLQPEFERYNINFKSNYQLNEDMQAYFEAKYVNSQSTDYGQPAFFFGSPVTVKRDNAFLHSSLQDLMDEKGKDSIGVRLFTNGLGQRIEDDTRETQRYVLGLKGYIGEDWEYDTYAIYGQTDLERVNKNNMIKKNFANAVDSIMVNGVAVCRDLEAREAGCVPINIFGEGNVTTDARDYINTVSTGTSVIKQTVLGGTITNSMLYELPAGDIGFSSGVEYRKEESRQNEPDNAEGTFFNVLGEDSGEYDVKEVFAEVNIPLLADLPAIQQLDLELAARYADYSTIGDATTWKAGLSWQLNDELRARSTYSRAIRAPNIGELYGALGQNFFNVDDSCKLDNLNDLTPEQAAVRKANCAALGVPSDFNSDYDSASIEGLSGGNDQLKEETSTSYTIGAIYQPDFIYGLSISADYWNIEIDDAISSVSAQNMIDKCLDSSTIDNIYCKRITRDPNSGEITSIVSQSLNIAKLEAAGVDLDIGYVFDLYNGDVNTNLVLTHLLKRNEYPFQGETDTYNEYAGYVGEAEWQANLTAQYSKDNWGVYWRTRFIDEVSLYTPQELEKNPNPSNNTSYGKYFISDASVSYSFENGIKLKFGVDNLFDRDLPYGTTGTGAGSASYDNVGRYYHATFSFMM